MNAIEIRPMRDEDAAAVLAIYAAGIAAGDATFEVEAPSWAAFDAGRLRAHRLVAIGVPSDSWFPRTLNEVWGTPPAAQDRGLRAEDAVKLPVPPADGDLAAAMGDRAADAGRGERGGRGGEAVLGWAAVSPVSTRPVYAGVVEHSVYVRPDAHGRGIGTALLRALIDSTEAAGIWTLQSGIFPENAASVALHERLGFRVVGRRVRLGRHQGRWRDVLLVERRSPVVA